MKHYLTLIFISLFTLTGYLSGIELLPDADTLLMLDFRQAVPPQVVLKSWENAPLPAIVAGHGLRLDGRGGHGEVPSALCPAIAQGDFTIEVLFQVATAEALKDVYGFKLLNNKSYSGKDTGFSLGYSAWKGEFIVFDYAQQGQRQSISAPLQSPLIPGQWHYAAVVRKGDLLQILLDGEVLADRKITGPIDLRHQRNIHIGSYATPFRNEKGKMLLYALQGTIQSIRISRIARKINAPPQTLAISAEDLKAIPAEVQSARCAVLTWSRNQRQAEKIIGLLQAMHLKAQAVDASNDLQDCDILIIPHADDVPVQLRDTLPPFLSKGKHLILDGWPTMHYDGDQPLPQWGEMIPGIAHCVRDRHSAYKAKHPWNGAVTLKGGGDGLNGKAIAHIKQVSGFDMAKCQWRLTGALGPGMQEFHDCIDFTPIAICEPDGQPVGQQVAGVRHFCSFFPGATILCADIQNDPALKLLYGKSAARYLLFLLKTAVAPLPDEPAADYTTNLFALRQAITTLKLTYNEAQYLTRDLHFHYTNRSPKDLNTANASVERFRRMENEAMVLFRQFAKFRYNRMPFAIRMKSRLLEKTAVLQKELEEFIRNGRQELSALTAAYQQPLFTIPEKGDIVIQLSFADYEPLSYGGTPGYVEYANGRAIAQLGIDGSVGDNYSLRHTFTDLPTPAKRAADDNNWPIFERYVRETGLKRNQSTDFTTYMVPLELHMKYGGKTYAPNLKTGEMTPVTDLSKGFWDRLGGNGIISEAMHSPEMEEVIQYLSKKTKGRPYVYRVGITSESMMMGGYSDWGFKRYREFLQNRHGTIAKLNETWRSNYASFDQIIPLAKHPHTPTEYANNFDWIEFRSKEFLWYMKRIVDACRKNVPEHLLSTCINQPSPLDGVEFYELTKICNSAGAHNTPTNRAWYQIGLAQRGQLADNSEPKWISINAPWNTTGAEEQLQMCQRYQMLYNALQGMREFAPYEWRHGTNARFGEYDGYLYLAGAEFKEFIKNKNRWQNLMGAIPPKDHAATGLFWSFVTKSQTRGGVVDAENGSSSLFRQYFGLMDSWNSLLDALQLPYQMVTRGKLREQDLSGLKSIIVPQASYLEPSTMDGLLAFAANGGELILEGQVGRYDQYKRDDERIFDRIGVVQCATLATRLSDGQSVQPLISAEEVGPAQIAFEAIAPEKVQVLQRYSDGTIAALRVPYGRGQIICVGFSLTGITPSSIREAILKQDLSWRMCSSPAEGVRLFPWKGQNGFYYIGVLNFSGDWRQVPVHFASPILQAYDVESGIAIPADDNTLRVPLFPAGARVIAVKFAN